MTFGTVNGEVFAFEHVARTFVFETFLRAHHGPGDGIKLFTLVLLVTFIAIDFKRILGVKAFVGSYASGHGLVGVTTQTFLARHPRTRGVAVIAFERLVTFDPVPWFQIEQSCFGHVWSQKTEHEAKHHKNTVWKNQHFWKMKHALIIDK